MPILSAKATVQSLIPNNCHKCQKYQTKNLVTSGVKFSFVGKVIGLLVGNCGEHCQNVIKRFCRGICTLYSKDDRVIWGTWRDIVLTMPKIFFLPTPRKVWLTFASQLTFLTMDLSRSMEETRFSTTASWSASIGDGFIILIWFKVMHGM